MEISEMRPCAAGCFSLAMLCLALGAAESSYAQTPNPTGTSPARSTAADAENTPAPLSDRDLAIAKQRNIERVGEPRLRLNPAGHSATIRAVTFAPDSSRLFSGGLDKVVQVWDLSALPAGVRLRNLQRNLLRERTIRWQVSRGPRGSVFALACAPDGLLAIGGYGAMGSTGEILLVNSIDGTFVKALEGHSNSIGALAFSADGSMLVSVDNDGECRLWQRGEWASRLLLANDATRYGKAAAAAIQGQPLLRPIATIKDSHVVVPVLVTPADARQPQWQLQQIALATGQVARKFDTLHAGVVTCLAVTADGSRMASVDFAGNLHLYDLTAQGRGTRLAMDTLVKSLAFSADGKTLAVGATAMTTREHELQFWNVTAQQVTSRRKLSEYVEACAYSLDGNYFAYTGGSKHELFVERLSRPEDAPLTLGGASRKIQKVAFAAAEPFDRVAFRTSGLTAGAPVALEESFDPARGQLVHGRPLPAADWLPENWGAGAWRAERAADSASLQLYEGKAARGIVQLDTKLQGFARSSCWIPNRDGQPFAIAVGTNKQNMICVFRIGQRGPCPLLRQFRGHEDAVNSVAVSRDLRLLVSGSADGTMQFWSLSDYQDALPTGRWGAGFNVADGKLVVQAINPAGPLFGKGVRKGDSIRMVRWKLNEENAQTQREDVPQEMLKRLSDLPWMTQVDFDVMRASGVPLAFQLVPAWQALGTLYADRDHEWAFWTPAGYYDASTNGHTLFGWQVNRGLQALPDFFRADQFRRNLERPDVMQQLLQLGNLDAALSGGKQAAAVEPESVLASEIAATPTVTILSPKPGEIVKNRQVKVRVQVTVPAGGKVEQSRVFANGVVARTQRLLSQQRNVASGAEEQIYEWDAFLPNESRNLIQVYVLSAAKTVAVERVLIAQTALPPKAKPRLYILALGVDDYQDPRIEDLDYSIADARALVAALEKETRGLYEVIPSPPLLGKNVNKARCLEEFASLSEKLNKSVNPDDLLVIFLAGHGEVDPRDRTYHYVCQDARYGTVDTLFDGKGSISWADFQSLADIPCRKIAILDTCHSGAIQGARRRNHQATRDFQENLLLTLAAAAGDESSQERTDWQHGAFTKSLLDGLAGSADRSKDGVVALDELVEYAHDTVTKMTDDQQHPTAAPQELLEFISLRLTKPQIAAPRAAEGKVAK